MKGIFPIHFLAEETQKGIIKKKKNPSISQQPNGGHELPLVGEEVDPQ